MKSARRQGSAQACSDARLAHLNSVSKGPTLYVANGMDIYRDAAAALLEPADSVLEVGCQLDNTTALLASRAARVIGVDVPSGSKWHNKYNSLQKSTHSGLEIMQTLRMQDCPTTQCSILPTHMIS